MKAKRYRTEQKIRILCEAEKAGQSIVELCREKGISEQTFHRWQREFGMMKLDQAKQLKELQKKNARKKSSKPRVVIEDWRYKYNHAPPHRSLGYITPIQFAGPAMEACPLTLPANPVRRSLDFLYNLKETSIPPRLTNYAAQFG
ncbi:MAG: transposase [Opitutales bacterium]|jgi:putative transposase